MTGVKIPVLEFPDFIELIPLQCLGLTCPQLQTLRCPLVPLLSVRPDVERFPRSAALPSFGNVNLPSGQTVSVSCWWKGGVCYTARSPATCLFVWTAGSASKLIFFLYSWGFTITGETFPTRMEKGFQFQFIHEATNQEPHLSLCFFSQKKCCIVHKTYI